MSRDGTAQFRAAIVMAGLSPPEAIEADKFYRFHGIGKHNGNTAGFCKLFADGLGGIYGDWSSGLSETWLAKRGKPLSQADRAAFRRAFAEATAQAEAKRSVERADAADEAVAIWNAARPATDDHPYLASKHIKAHGLRLHQGRLVVPMYADGELHSLQFIGADGDKRFLPGGRTKGCYFIIGETEYAAALGFAEGYATGATVHEAAGCPVVVTFGAGNLAGVAQAIRKKFPKLPFFFCADDDYQTEGNPGLTKATEAARLVDGLLAIPDFGPDRPDGATDFNDTATLHGLEAVKRTVASALAPATSDPGPGTGNAPTGNSETRCAYGGGEFCVNESGVFFIGADKYGNALPPRWICSPLWVIAETRDAKSREWGRLLEWRDDDSVEHRWAMPLELLQGDGSEVRRELARLGLSIAPGKAARDLLASYLQVWPVQARARCVERLGWHAGVYVTPGEVIGESGDLVVFQNAHAIEPALSVAGTADEWRAHVASLAAGNSRLVLGVCVAFAAPLVGIVDEDSGGFHLRGTSSTGKTTVLKVAASVWGDPAAYVRLWRATANGLEGLAALHNDGALILDELCQIDPREAGEAAYLLANGQGKARAARNGTARAAQSWRLLFLSAGEMSLTALMATAGKRANAGQEIRLADIDADAGVGMGAFEELHGHETPAALALAIKDAAARLHGAVGLEWLRRIVADRPKLADFLADGIRQFVVETAPKDAAGQVLRVARRFALVAAAGERATFYGLTGWHEGEAIEAARKCFRAWLESFGGAGNREERAALAQIRAFFEAHGASRFEDVTATNEPRIPNRAGFCRTGSAGEREFLVLPEVFRREVCHGFDARAVTKALLARGWLEPDKAGKAQRREILPGLGRARCYVFTPRMWKDEENDNE